jgi:hypothetical protein
MIESPFAIRNPRIQRGIGPIRPMIFRSDRPCATTSMIGRNPCDGSGLSFSIISGVFCLAAGCHAENAERRDPGYQCDGDRERFWLHPGVSDSHPLIHQHAELPIVNLQFTRIPPGILQGERGISVGGISIRRTIPGGGAPVRIDKRSQAEANHQDDNGQKPQIGTPLRR